eukprot:8221101-Alexandrium_andersonii.AAC.1
MAEWLGKKSAASVGLAGQHSFNCMVFPALIWLLRRARPDLEIHVPDIGEPRRAATKKMLAVAEH